MRLTCDPAHRDAPGAWLTEPPRHALERADAPRLRASLHPLSALRNRLGRGCLAHAGSVGFLQRNASPTAVPRRVHGGVCRSQWLLAKRRALRLAHPQTKHSLGLCDGVVSTFLPPARIAGRNADPATERYFVRPSPGAGRHPQVELSTGLPGAV